MVKFNLVRKKKKGIISVILSNEQFNEYYDITSEYNKSICENLNKWAKDKGYENYLEYYSLVKNIIFDEKKNRALESIKKNQYCSIYLGIYIAEQSLKKVFKNVVWMSIRNKGYDFVCDKGNKIDVKSSCLRFSNGWSFVISKNKIADYFLLVAFDNRENIKPLHLWLIKGNELVKFVSHGKYVTGNCLNDLNSLYISSKDKILEKYRKYELVNKIDEVEKYCNDLKNSNEYHIKKYEIVKDKSDITEKYIEIIINQYKKNKCCDNIVNKCCGGVVLGYKNKKC